MLYLPATVFKGFLIAKMSRGMIHMVDCLKSYDGKFKHTMLDAVGGQCFALMVLISALIRPLWFM